MFLSASSGSFHFSVRALSLLGGTWGHLPVLRFNRVALRAARGWGGGGML